MKCNRFIPFPFPRMLTWKGQSTVPDCLSYKCMHAGHACTEHAGGLKSCMCKKGDSVCVSVSCCQKSSTRRRGSSNGGEPYMWWDEIYKFISSRLSETESPGEYVVRNLIIIILNHLSVPSTSCCTGRLGRWLRHHTSNLPVIGQSLVWVKIENEFAIFVTSWLLRLQ